MVEGFMVIVGKEKKMNKKREERERIKGNRIHRESIKHNGMKEKTMKI